MKYLGVYLCSDLSRRCTVSNRVKAGYKAFFMLRPFLLANRLPLAMILALYHTVIAPMVLYGLKVSTITKENRDALRKMEDGLVRSLASLARDPPASPLTVHLLKGKTIVRKCRTQRLKYWGHVIRRPERHVLRRALLYRVPGKRKLGRPCFTWNEILRRDVRTSKVRNWDRTVHDKKKHNAKCDRTFEEESSDTE